MVTAMPDKGEVRARLLKGWDAVIRLSPQSSSFGRRMLESDDEDDAAETLRLSMFSKANSTLSARLGPILSYIKWGGEEAWPPSEKQAYAYMQALAMEEAPPTKANQFLEALRFSHFVVGFECLREISKSSRLEGLAAE